MAPPDSEILALIDKWMDHYDHLGTGSAASERMSMREWEEDRAKIVSLLTERKTGGAS